MTKKKSGKKHLSNHQVIEQNINDNQLINDKNKTDQEIHLQSIVAKEPLKKHLSVQFYPVDHVQFISNRSGKK